MRIRNIINTNDYFEAVKRYNDLKLNNITVNIDDMNTLANSLMRDCVSRQVLPVTNISVTKDSCKDLYADDIIIITVYINTSSIATNEAISVIRKYTELYAETVRGLDNTRVIVVPSKIDRETEVRVVSRRSDCIEEKSDGNTIEDNHKDNKKTKKRV